MDALSFNVSSTALRGLSLVLRCGPAGTRFPLEFSTASRRREDAPSPRGAGHDEEFNLSLAFGDDERGAFLRLAFDGAPSDPPPALADAPARPPTLASAEAMYDKGMFSPFGTPSAAPLPLVHADSPALSAANSIATSSSSADSPRASLHVPPSTAVPESFKSVSQLHPFPSNPFACDTFMAMISSQDGFAAHAFPDSLFPDTPTPFSTSPSLAPSAPPSVPPTRPPSPHRSPAPSVSEGASPASSSAPAVPEAELPYACTHPGCARRFKRAYNRSLHLKTHEARPRKRFCCPFPVCKGQKFSRKHDLFRHIGKMHDGAMEWTCEWCGPETKFASSEELARHVRVHWEKSDIEG